MKDEYILYLDESLNTHKKKFAIGGFAIKKDNVTSFESSIMEVKKLIWNEEYIEQNTPILHCTELENVYRDRNTKKKIIEKPYDILHTKSGEEIEKIYTQLYGRLSKIIKSNHITIFGCYINVRQLQELYFLDKNHNGIHLIDDEYNIAMQNIIENYTHYLCFVDGYGDVIYESRNADGENSAKSADIRLINNFHQIHANNRGIVYTNSKTIQERNRTIQTLSKKSDSAGLQFADFIVNNIIKLVSCKEDTQKTDFMKQIHLHSYNGGRECSEKDQRAFWGISVLPSYLHMQDLENQIRSLRNSNKNLKSERNRLKKDIDNYQQQILALKAQIGNNGESR